METLPQIAELGTSGIMLGILFFIVKSFVASIKEKDEFIKELTTSFNKTINNHIAHETVQREKETATLERLANVIERLVDKPKRSRKSN